MWRLWSCVVILILLAGCAAKPDFKGFAPAEKRPAPDFKLKDQLGREVALSDFRGKVVVMNFLYTGCKTVCPVWATRYMAAAKELGDEVGKSVVFLVVTVDPERDTVERVREYSASFGMLDKWHYLTGSYGEVEQVWRAYGVYVNKSSVDEKGSYDVDHTVTATVIDKRGYIRLYFLFSNESAEDMVSDVRILMRE